MRVLVVVLLFLATAVHAADSGVRERIAARVHKTFPNANVTDVRDAPVPGIVEVEINGSDRVYVTEDGRYMFTGDLYQLAGEKGKGGGVNITEQRFQKVRREGLKKLKKDDMITFAASPQKAQVYVFTDVSCPYCRKLQQHIRQINGLGITVHYLAFPRAGTNSTAARTMQKVWCANDRQKALTEATLSGGITEHPKPCKDPVASEYNLGIKFGVHGTPAIYSSSGKQLGGYVAPNELAGALGIGAKAAD